MNAVLRLCMLFVAFSMPVAHSGEPAGDMAKPGVIRLSEPVEVTDSYEVFGAPLSLEGKALSLAQLIDDSDKYLNREVQVTTRVAKVCQKKGCFFIAQDGDAVARVTFKDYEFFIPTDSADKQVTLSGTFKRKALTAKQAGHYAKDIEDADAGAAKARSEYQIVASSIRIPKS